jgi:hypothetical protein
MFSAWHLSLTFRTFCPFNRPKAKCSSTLSHTTGKEEIGAAGAEVARSVVVHGS